MCLQGPAVLGQPEATGVRVVLEQAPLLWQSPGQKQTHSCYLHFAPAFCPCTADIKGGKGLRALSFGMQRPNKAPETWVCASLALPQHSRAPFPLQMPAVPIAPCPGIRHRRAQLE